MTRVLLITDTERVQRIFEALEEKGVLQLQTASTLTRGESEITASPADFTFVQGRISGFSGEILLRHLDKILPKGAQLVLLAGDAEDAAHAKKHGRRSLDLSLSDELLEQTAHALVTGAAIPAAATGEAPHAVNTAPAKAKPATPTPAVTEKPEQDKEPVQSGSCADVPEQEPGKKVSRKPVAEKPVAEKPVAEAPVADKPVAEEPSVPAPAQVAEQGEAVPFEEMMRRASANVGPLKPGLVEVEDRVELGKDVSAPEEASDAAAGDEDKKVDQVPAGAFLVGESLADAMLRAEKKKERRPYRIILPALFLISIPLFFYFAGRITAPDSKTAAISKPTQAPAAPTAIPPAAAPQVKQPPPPALPATEPKGKAKPEAKRGLKALPPFLEGTRPDADYGKSHPGWVRYIGKRAEYKLFKEAELYRAMQVMAVGGGTISDDLFKTALREFGGIEGYRVESSSQKGDYLVEQCATKGSASLTIYRNKSDRKMKALVVYYR